MYAALKKTAKALIPSGLMYALEPTIRAGVAAFYSGNAVSCPLCERSFKHFIQLRADDSDSDLLCPYCASIQRSRLMWLYLNNELNIASEQRAVLHFSPHRYMSDRLRKLANVSYTTTDYESTRADKNWDITNLPAETASYDLVICYHVMEHIPDDRTAMAEVFRVLKPGGVALLQVPHREAPTDEDPSITDPAIRLQRFGQDDHVRWYNRQDFVDRLSETGFSVEQLKYAQEVTAEQRERAQLREHEIIFVCRK